MVQHSPSSAGLCRLQSKKDTQNYCQKQTTTSQPLFAQGEVHMRIKSSLGDFKGNHILFLEYGPSSCANLRNEVNCLISVSLRKADPCLYLRKQSKEKYETMEVFWWHDLNQISKHPERIVALQNKITQCTNIAFSVSQFTVKVQNMEKIVPLSSN